LDTDRARQLFERSAAQHSPAGLLGLSHLYETGQAVSRDPARALSLYRESAQLGLLPAQLRLAHALLSQGDASARPEALGWLRLAAAQDSPQAMNDYAWLLATSGDPQERDAERAVHYATAAVAQDANASYLDTLAAAYAAADEFDQAIRVQQQAIAALEPANQDLLPEFNQRLAQYLEGKRWQE
jgi:TPR repeat protein